MKQTTKQLLEILENKRGNLYDFIANEYWRIDKDTLKDLALEIVALLYVYGSRLETNNEKANKDIHKELLEQIKEYRPNLIEEEAEDF